MMRLGPLALGVCLGLTVASAAPAREAKLVRYPHYHQGKVAFCYLGDIWTASDAGKDVVRLTANKARDVYPRFSPDGTRIAFSSDRDGGGLDVYLIPAQGGAVTRLTTHPADDVVLNWTPDGKSVLFASQRGEGFMGKLYTVPVDGGLPRDAGPDMGVAGSYSPDGTKLAVNRKAQVYWRKHYRGAYQSDVTVMDLSARTFKDLTDFDGMDSWPLWSQDGHIYFVSDRDPGAQANLWRVPESGGDAEKVTTFTDGDVRFPSISADGRTIAFERDFGISLLDVASRKVTPLKFEIAAETQESLTDFREFNSTVDDYDLTPDGKRIAFSVHGEVFTAPTGETGELSQITDGPARDRDVVFSPDGSKLAYVSDESGREEVYAAPADGAGPAKKVTDLDTLKSSLTWSPDSKSLAFTGSDGKLYTIKADGKDLKTLATSKYGNISRPAWSPDGHWIAFSRADVSRSTDVYLVPADGGDEKKVTFDPFDERNPQFSADARTLYFLRTDGGVDGSDRPSSQLFCMPLEKIEKDPEDSDDPSDASPDAPRRGMGTRSATPPKEPKIDWPGLKRRTRQVTRTVSSVSTFIPGNDGKTLLFVASEGGGRRGGGGGGGGAAIYSIQDNGKRMNRLTASNPAPIETDGDTPRGGGFGGGISGLNLSRDGRTLYFQEGDSVYSVSASGGGGGGGGFGGGGRGGDSTPTGATAGATAGGGGGSRKKVTFHVTVKVEKPREWEEMFDDAWRTMKYRFYDPKMHDKDWDAARAKYKPLVAFVGDRQELLNLINEMIGELNASHTGAAAGGGNGGRGESTGVGTTRHLGLDLKADDASGRYKVTHVYENGPADKDWIKVSPGDYLLAIDGKPLKAGDDYWERLGRRLNRKVELTLNSAPKDEGAWKVKYEPISMTAYGVLRYERWVKQRREMADKLSGGRVGYLHIKDMDGPSLARFKKELAEFRHKEGLVIDQRFNGGGNIEQELLAILVQRPYQVWQPRGTEPTQRPFAGYFGPKVVLQNWRSASNAEMFPAGFRALGLGRLVGTRTMGAVIGTGSYSLIDGSTIRTPGVGVYLADDARTNMENTGVKPDITVENTPEDNLADRDRQLETAVREVLKDLKPGDKVAGKE